MKKENQANKVIAEMFGIDVKDIESKTRKQATQEKLTAYARAEEIERAGMYALEVHDNERLKRDIVRYVHESISLVHTLNMTDGASLALRRTVYDFFKDFPGFTQGTASSIGRFYNKAVQQVIAEPGAVAERGRYVHVMNIVMQGVDKRAKSEFFVKLRRNFGMREEFKNRLEHYCKTTWFIIMEQYGTVGADNELFQAVNKDRQSAKDFVRAFIQETCVIASGESVTDKALYSAYEAWCESSEAPMLGKEKFAQEIMQLIPGIAMTIRRNKANVWNGISIKSKAAKAS